MRKHGIMNSRTGPNAAGDATFLAGEALSDRIRLICAEAKVDCAVAFWGADLRDDLFPRWKRQKATVRIICDIAMGCNLRIALKRYGAPGNTGLRVLDGLHAKVFISRAGAVVGSANASANGIGFADRPARNREAGTFFPANSEGWHQAVAFFAACLRRSLPLDQRQLDRAPERATDPRPRIGASGKKTTSLLAMIVAHPARSGDILFIGEHEGISAAAEQKSNSARDRHEQTTGEKMAGKALILRYRPDYLPFAPTSVVMLWHGKWVAYGDVVAVPEKSRATLWGDEAWRRFWSERGPSRPVKRPLPDELAFLQGIRKGQ